MPFRTALSGLNASSADLRVIGNNVANASTTGFKKSRTEFSDIYASANLGASSTTIGSGVRVAEIDQQFSQGNISFTDNNLDIAISGQGFFRLNDNGVTTFTRNGTFGVDRSGYIVNAQDQRLTGFLADTSGNITGALGDIQLDSSDIAPQATSTVDFGLNIDASAAVIPAATVFSVTNASSYNNSTSLTIYDSLGSSHLSTVYYRKEAANTWRAYSYIDGNPVNAAGDTLTFDNLGNLQAINGVAAATSYTLPAYATTNGSANIVLTMDYSNVNQYGGGFNVNSLTQDGYATGRLSGIDIDDSGVIQARFTNGQTRTLAQLSLANFSNPQGLQQLGDTNWAETFESGQPLIGSPGSSSLGLVQSGALEGSNVDLTEQLVNMITAQRNFQANAQVISTADTITQAIINIR